MAGSVGVGRRRALKAYAAAIAAACGTGRPPVVIAQAGGLVEPPRFSALAVGTHWGAAGDADPQSAGRTADGRHGWLHRPLRGIAPNRFSIVHDAGESILAVDVKASASALTYRFQSAPSQPILRWRWRAERFPERAEPGVKERDDFAARLYLMFDLPEARLTLADRLALATAGLLQGEPVPAATLVYLLHQGPTTDQPIVSPFTDRVAMWVARGNAQAGRWYEESRNWQQDFQRAFGRRYPGPTPAPVAIAVGADGDQTGASFRALWGDLSFG